MFLHEPATQATDPRVSDPSKRSCCAVETPDREGGRVNPGPTSAAYDAETPSGAVRHSGRACPTEAATPRATEVPARL